ncbi:MAG: phosphatase PAP2 family protein [Acidobacteriota bacterium]
MTPFYRRRQAAEGMPDFRKCEWICLAYFVYTAAVAAVRPVSAGVRLEVWAADAAVLAALVWLASPRAARRPLWTVVRDWFPLALILLAYRQMGWMALPHGSQDFEHAWIGLDRLLLHEWGLKRAMESLGPLLPNVLELSYLLVYIMPVAATAVFYAFGGCERLDDAYQIILSATMAAYALYPYFPSEPPRAVFPLDDLPVMSALRAFNLTILGAYGIHMSVFPSGHAAAAFSCAFAVRRLLPERPVAGRVFLLMAVLIAVATVYGRYHFAIDTIAGLAMALAASWVHRAAFQRA